MNIERVAVLSMKDLDKTTHTAAELKYW